MANRYPLIFNPSARSQRGRRTLRFLMTHAQRFALYASQSAEDAVDLARSFAERGEPIVVAAGGDGTLNAVVQGLAGSSTALGVLPAGTMNVFARELGLPHASLRRSLDVLDAGYVKEVDLYEANGHAFVQMAGVGLDAQVIEETDSEAKKMFGPMAYLTAAVRVLGERPPKMRVICDDGRVEEGVCVLAGNGSLYGGQLKLFRKADNMDEMLDALVFTEAGYKLVLDSVRGLATGAIDAGNSSVNYLQARSFKIECESSVPMEVDGEFLGRVSEVRIDPAERKLRVIAPENPKEGIFASVLQTLINLPRK
ncbi:diacylglycerol kinase family lipid kinase [Verrucomicrobiaceae bacterium 5K15]|uniref:Diacylglycerol kinase family lipid kinase n=1 Tax=Oceaniferula flava TaxID=2800421 RepID=A0AAE2V7U5_9BACT|nr:diacylglycerol kinase family lipid kinase [Oceaniferula flavus]MBK1854412.1 diacylglycerol kinase family lipid kinase [Oceaniferula flavus]MBM1135718.1 diacylglycerol kinase family lipid kinase [Oceaniferula flavus]